MVRVLSRRLGTLCVAIVDTCFSFPMTAAGAALQLASRSLGL
jgi:hypothetical protein